MFGYRVGDPNEDLSFDGRDSAPFMPKSGDRPGVHLGAGPAGAAALARDDHLRDARQGFTMRHPEVPEAARGTFAGLSRAAVVGYLQASASPRSSCCRCTPSSTTAT